MPTPVAAARQCLTQESAAVLDDAVGVARRRGHAQTTSLHMVSSLLSLPSSSLREACSRTRSNAYSTRVQFKALELSLSVSLDRLPSSQAAKHDEPPVSNSLMAAIKRSQANQRRQPENFSFYQQQQQFSSAPLVKVELQNLIVSILDDPLVSRVFGEAGFRSCDIKMATLRPGIGSFQVLGCTSRYKRPSPPLFLCNLTASEGDVGINGGKGFSFPFMGCFSGDDSARRIGEVMLRDKKKCPLLLGISATDALTTFLETVRRGGGGGALPDGLSGLRVERVADEILGYLSDGDEGPLKLRLEEVEGSGGGVVVDFGDLGALVGDGVAAEKLKFLVGSLGRLVAGGKVWLIGVAAAYEVYFKILNRFPSIEEDWQLGVLPITSFKFAMGGSYPRSSLMESFVPLGGFFSLPPETNAGQYVARCHLCNDKYEQEVAAVSNGAEKHQSGSIKGTDDGVLLNAKISGLQKKWDGICQQHHLGRPHAHQAPPRVLGFQVGKGNDRSDNSNESSNDKNAESTHLQKSSSSLTSKSGEIVPPKMNPSAADDDRASPSSVTSVTTDLGLAIVDAFNPTISNDLVKDPKLLYRALLQRVGHQEEAVSSVVEAITRGTSRRNIWINVRGGDGLSKKKLGLAMAEVMYRSRESLIYVDLSFQEEVMMSQVDALFNAQIINKYELTMRGTVVDYLVEKLSRKPAVVFLDNVDKADLVVQKTLLQAMRSGRFTDWCGREVSISNCIFLGATGLSEGNEEEVAGARGGAMQIVVRFDLSDDDPTVNKRKLVGRGSDRSSIISGSSHEMAKRAHKEAKSKSYLDLNLPAEGSEVCNVESESESGSESSRSSWMEELEREVDETVVFKQFDFAALEKKVSESVAGCLRDVVGCECAVEVEGKAMKQIVAAGYLYGGKVVEDWIESVVRQGFVEAMGKYSLSGRSIVRVDAVGEEQPQPRQQPQGLLPGRVAVK